jgi:hypothetical protein
MIARHVPNLRRATGIVVSRLGIHALIACTQLAHLEIDGYRDSEDHEYQPSLWRLGALTALTHLQMPLCRDVVAADISKLSTLQALHTLAIVAIRQQPTSPALREAVAWRDARHFAAELHGLVSAMPALAEVELITRWGHRQRVSRSAFLRRITAYDTPLRGDATRDDCDHQTTPTWRLPIITPRTTRFERRAAIQSPAQSA